MYCTQKTESVWKANSKHNGSEKVVYERYDKNFFLKLLLGAFAKLRKATITFVISICPSVRMSVPHETTQLQLDEF